MLQWFRVVVVVVGFYFGALPDVLGMFRVLLHNRKDTARDDSMGAAEIVVDFFAGIR